MLSPGLVFTLLGYVVGAAVFWYSVRNRGFSKAQGGWLLFAAITGGILGAKVIRWLFAASAGSMPLGGAFFDGRTIIGGIICGWASVELSKIRLGIKHSTGDAFALALPAGEAMGRLGCLFNQCCYGSPCSLPWAVYQHGAWRHPAQLYSMAVAIAELAVLLCLQHRFRGRLFPIYLAMFASSRFFLEFLRQRSEIHLGFSMAQWVCLEIAASLLLGALWYRFYSSGKQRVAKQDGK